MWKYEIWFDSSCIIDRTSDDDCEYETEQEAMEEAIEDVINRIEQWKCDDAWHGETVEDFDIRVKEALWQDT